MTMTLLATSKLLRLAVLAAALAPCFATAAAGTAGDKPKLVVVLVVDGLPQEQVTRYRDQFGQGGFRRLLDQGAWFSNAHQGHGITVTAVGHSAVLTGAYPYQHGIIGNNWIDPVTLKKVYCTEDAAHTYIGEETDANDGTSPANLRVSTLGDELRYSNGNQAKVITVSGKDRGAILLAGKTGTAYMYMEKTGNFASSTFYMPQHPEWVQRYQATKPQARYFGKSWTPLLADSAYSQDAPEVKAVKAGKPTNFPFLYEGPVDKPDKDYYDRHKTTPFLDELTLDFARAAIIGENLGKNPAGVPDVLGVSLSAHDYINHSYGPESKMSHDHMQRLDRMLASFFNDIDKRIGMDNVLVVLTADHGFPNVPEFARQGHKDADRINEETLMAALEKHLSDKFAVADLIASSYMPNIYLDYARIERSKLKREDVENAVARFLLAQPGVANAYTRSQFEAGGLSVTRMDTLMRRAWHRQISGDVLVVPKPFWIFGKEKSGTSHGTPYSYDTNVPLMIMGKRWIKPGAYGQAAEVVDIAPTLAHLLRVRPPSASEGRVLVESLR